MNLRDEIIKVLNPKSSMLGLRGLVAKEWFLPYVRIEIDKMIEDGTIVVLPAEKGTVGTRLGLPNIKYPPVRLKNGHINVSGVFEEESVYE